MNISHILYNEYIPIKGRGIYAKTTVFVISWDCLIATHFVPKKKTENAIPRKKVTLKRDR